MRILTAEVFIERSQAVWGTGKFDYSEVEYEGQNVPVKIKCVEHDCVFEQAPINHMNNKDACPLCADEKLRIRCLEQFKDTVLNTHGDKYVVVDASYSHKMGQGTVKGICKEHGEFTAHKGTWRKGIPCPLCSKAVARKSTKGKSQPWTEERFLSHMKDKFSDKVCFDKLVFSDLKTPVTLICKEHGEYTAMPFALIRNGSKGGCKQCVAEACGKRFADSPEKFAEKIRAVHGDRYEFYPEEYVPGKKVRVTCREHGDFYIRSNHFTEGSGCKRCADNVQSEARKKDGEHFIKRAKERHGELYDYSKSVYVDAKTPLTIACATHGDFAQSPANHMFISGCPSCATYGFKQGKAGKVYVLESENMVKVGITNREVYLRCDKINLGSPEKFQIKYEIDLPGRDCQVVELRTLHWLKTITTQVGYKFDGSTETFVKVPVEIIINKIEELAKEVADGRESTKEDGACSADYV